MLPNSTPLIQTQGKVHGIIRRQAHGRVHDVTYGRVHGKVRALLGGSRLIGLEDTDRTDAAENYTVLGLHPSIYGRIALLDATCWFFL